MEKISDLQIGKAGEYLVCADLIMNGYIAFLSEQGLSYDIVLDNGISLNRIQVKTTQTFSEQLYHFHIGRSGKCGRKKYAENAFDFYALVALDTKEIAYIKKEEIKTYMQFRVTELKGTYIRDRTAKVKKIAIYLKDKLGKSNENIASELQIEESKIYGYVCKNRKKSVEGKYFSDYPLSGILKSSNLSISKSVVKTSLADKLMKKRDDELNVIIDKYEIPFL